MRSKTLRLAASAALGLALCLLLSAPAARADVIVDGDIFRLTGNEIGSGNGTLDWLLFTESSGGSGNAAGGFNGDDACTDMPTGSGKTTAVESYITSVGELRDFFRLNFPDGQGGSTVSDIVLCVDLNQTGPLDVVLNKLDVVIDYDAGFGDDRDNPAGTDITSQLQNRTDDGFSGGTVVANLDSAKTLPLNEQGAGWADYAILTGIDPFDSAFTDETRILVHWDSSGHDDGGESIFISGTYSSEDIPEPGALVLLAIGGLVAATKRRR